jgi:2,4-dienoyl-CoA reductase-like NADH-dependent reductase (Old Yellow Enzyme family)
MPPFFKFKTLESLRDTVAQLDLDLAFDDALDPLLTGYRLHDRAVGNRLAIQPMEGCDATLDGRPGELTFRRYERFGAGGAKLIWGEACAVVPEGRANPRQLVIRPETVSDLARLAALTRSAHRTATGIDDDLLVGLQLTHSGRWCCERPIVAQADPLLDPLRPGTARQPGHSPWAHQISDDELDRLQDAYVTAASLARQAGFDFVDLKQCHRYLLNELLAARLRPGRYGGSFENRTRFICSVVARIRAACPELIVATRLNVFDGLPFTRADDGTGVAVPFERPVETCWGTDRLDPTRPDLSEPIQLVKQLRALGVRLVNVTLGNPYASPHLLRPCEFPPIDGYRPPEHPLVGVARHIACTRAIQKAAPDVVVVGSGYSWLQQFAFAAGAAEVRAAGVTAVGIGRGSLAQPDFALRIQSGQGVDSRRVCRTFSYCTSLMRSKSHPLGQYPTGCPPFDKEVYGPIWKRLQAGQPEV